MQRRSAHLRTRTALCALLAFVAVTAIACAPSHASGTKVLLVGDSMFNGSRDEVTSALVAAGWEPTIEADGGTATTFWAPRMSFLAARYQPDLVVIGLGANDCSDVECVPLGPYIDQIVSSFPSSTLVVWLNAQTDVPPPFNENRDFVNDALTAADVRWPNLSVIDFAGHFAGHPEWHNPDGLHPNEAGSQELARLITDELDGFKPK